MWVHDWLVPLAIAGMGIALRARYFNYFLVPDTDFFPLRQTAVALVQGGAPPSYQRLPVFSALMGGMAPLFHGGDPFLLAAESINLGAFAGATFFLYRLAQKFLGGTAWIVAFLFALDGLGFHMTAQPRTELPTVALVIIGCSLAIRRPTAAYVPAALAALTRYEGAFLVPALLARDLVFGPRRWRAVLLAGLASAGLIAWLVLNFRATGHLNPYFSYVGGTTTAAGGAFISVLLQACLDSLGLQLTGMAASVASTVLAWLIVGGLVRMLRIATFFALTLALNLAFFSPTPEHAFMIVWVCELAVVAALTGLATLVGAALPASDGGTRLGSFSGVLLGAAAVIGVAGLIWSAHHVGGGLPKAALLVTLVALGAIAANGRPQRLGAAVPIAVAIVALPLLVQRDLLAIDTRLSAVADLKGELRRAGEWFAAHAGPGQRMAVTEPLVVAAYAGSRPDSAFVATQTLTAERPAELKSELARRGIDYILWNSHHGTLPPASFYYHKYRIDLLEGLSEGKSSPDFELLDTLRAGPTYAYVYRLRR